jgi:hypothetical protein
MLNAGQVFKRTRLFIDSPSTVQFHSEALVIQECCFSERRLRIANRASEVRVQVLDLRRLQPECPPKLFENNRSRRGVGTPSKRGGAPPCKCLRAIECAMYLRR